LKRNRERKAFNLSDSIRLSDHIRQIQGSQICHGIEKVLKIKSNENSLITKTQIMFFEEALPQVYQGKLSIF